MATNYFKENFRHFWNFMYETVDRYPYGNWESEELREGFKINVVGDYMNFIYNLNFLNINSDSKLYKQIKFSDKLQTLVSRYKNGGFENAIPNNETHEKFLEILHQHLSDWLQNNLDDELKHAEREYYTKLAFSKEDNPSQQLANKIARDKEDVLLTLKNKNRINLG